MSIFWAEFWGTLLLILLGDGVVANVLLKNTKGNNGGWIVITLAWGLAVFVGVVIAAPYSGAHLNPAVTAALITIGKTPLHLAPTYISAQMLGAFTGAVLVWIFYYDHFPMTENKKFKRMIFCTAPAMRHVKVNLFSEVLGTFVLIFAILYNTGPILDINGSNIQHFGLGSLGALPVALIVVVIGLSLGGTTGYAINPARDLGPRIAHAILPISGKGISDWHYAWIPIVGPIAGALIACAVYHLLGV